jgi:hypothetical protein
MAIHKNHTTCFVHSLIVLPISLNQLVLQKFFWRTFEIFYSRLCFGLLIFSDFSSSDFSEWTCKMYSNKLHVTCTPISYMLQVLRKVTFNKYRKVTCIKYQKVTCNKYSGKLHVTSTLESWCTSCEARTTLSWKHVRIFSGQNIWSVSLTTFFQNLPGTEHVVKKWMVHFACASVPYFKFLYTWKVVLNSLYPDMSVKLC